MNDMQKKDIMGEMARARDFFQEAAEKSFAESEKEYYGDALTEFFRGKGEGFKFAAEYLQRTIERI